MEIKRTAVVILSLFVLVSACASYPQDLVDQAAYNTNKASEAISKDDCDKASYWIEIALSLPTGAEKIRKLFTSNPKGLDCYLSYLEKAISDVSSGFNATEVFEKLTVAKSSRILSETQLSQLFANLNKVVTEGNRTGSVPFILGDNIDVFPELKSPEHQQFIIDRSIIKLQGDDYGRRPSVAALMDYVQRVGVDSVEGRRIESLLPTMNINGYELDVVAKLFPVFLPEAINQFIKMDPHHIQIHDYFEVDGTDQDLGETKETIINRLRDLGYEVSFCKKSCSHVRKKQLDDKGGSNLVEERLESNLTENGSTVKPDLILNLYLQYYHSDIDSELNIQNQEIDKAFLVADMYANDADGRPRKLWSKSMSEARTSKVVGDHGLTAWDKTAITLDIALALLAARYGSTGGYLFYSPKTRWHIEYLEDGMTGAGQRIVSRLCDSLPPAPHTYGDEKYNASTWTKHSDDFIN